jgi:uncharacterized protein (DUF4415 family)
MRRLTKRERLVKRREFVTLSLSRDVRARWRASGKGWQTRAAALLVQHAPAA